MSAWPKLLMMILFIGGLAGAIDYVGSAAIARDEVPRLKKFNDDTKASLKRVAEASAQERAEHEQYRRNKDQEAFELRALAEKALKVEVVLDDPDPYCRPGCLLIER